MSDLFSALTPAERHALVTMLHDGSELLEAEAEAAGNTPEILLADYGIPAGTDPWTWYFRPSRELAILANELQFAGYESPVWAEV